MEGGGVVEVVGAVERGIDGASGGKKAETVVNGGREGEGDG